VCDEEAKPRQQHGGSVWNWESKRPKMASQSWWHFERAVSKWHMDDTRAVAEGGPWTAGS
jgi:hypothetical protein